MTLDFVIPPISGSSAAQPVAPVVRGQHAAIRNIVLVHGDWADGSSWRAVHSGLVALGYRVSIAQNPLSSLAADVASTLRLIERQDGPTVLVGHSYGGSIISEAGNAANVAALVYVAAFMPGAGESALGLVPTHPRLEMEVTPDGYLFMTPACHRAHIASDLSLEEAAFLCAAQAPVAIAAFAGKVSQPAWHHKPSWYLLAEEDNVIPAQLQRRMARRAGAILSCVPGSHSVHVSHPTSVVALIDRAARGYDIEIP